MKRKQIMYYRQDNVVLPVKKRACYMFNVLNYKTYSKEVLFTFLWREGAEMLGYEVLVIIKKTGKTIIDIVMKL